MAASLTTIFTKNRLARRFTLWLLIGSTLLSVIASGLQLYSSYQRDVKVAKNIPKSIQQNFAPSLSNALWHFDFRQTRVILDTIVAHPSVTAVRLEAETGHRFAHGDMASSKPADRATDTDTDHLHHVIAIFHNSYSGEDTFLGTLNIAMTLKPIQQELLSQFLVLLATNLVKAFLASAIALLLFYFLISRHLHKISESLRDFQPEATQQALSLNRKTKDQEKDDLDAVVDAINLSQRYAADAYRSVKALNGELDTTNAVLCRTNDELTLFAHAAAHDLQEPLRKINFIADILRQDYCGQLDHEGNRYLQNMADAARRLRMLIKDMLEYSALDQNHEPPQAIDLNAVINSIVADMSLRLNETEGAVEVEDLPKVLAQHTQMVGLFSNLISNALKYHRPGVPPHIQISAYQDSAAAHDHFAIMVKDNGIGFSQSHADQIFEPFKRLHTADSYEGTGIGLAICRKTVDRLGGQIRAIANPDAGASFVVTLPKARAA